MSSKLVISVIVFLHHVRQMLNQFRRPNFSHFYIACHHQFIWFYVIPINSFENNNIHDKNKSLKELVKHSTIQSLLDTSMTPQCLKFQRGYLSRLSFLIMLLNIIAPIFSWKTKIISHSSLVFSFSNWHFWTLSLAHKLCNKFWYLLL